MTSLVSNSKLLVCPLNWGLGHASRCISLIRFFLDKGIEVHLATDGDALLLLKREFENLQFHELPAYNIHYSKDGNQSLKLITQLPKINKAVRREHKFIESLCDKHQFTAVISDNRLGAFSRYVPSYYITHQVNIKTGLGSRIASLMHQSFFKNYREIWIPDEESIKLSGELSSGDHRYIGFLSRAKKKELKPTYRAIAVLSGPEPQRSILEKELLSQFGNTEGPFILVRGSISVLKETIPDNVKVFDLLSGKELDEWVARAKVFIGRTGYSSLMDLLIWNKPAVLIPTPGQGEQEYLAEYINKQFGMYTVKQSQLQIVDQMTKAKAFSLNVKDSLNIPQELLGNK